VTDLRNLRKKLDNSEDLTKHKISYTSFIVKAVVQALKMYPIINSSLIDNKIIVKKYFNIGVAVSRKNGLIVVVIHNAEQKNLNEISLSIKNKVERARRNVLLPQDVSGGTFTITNVGMFGTIMNTPIINFPESAILGVGTIQKKPVVINDQIVIRSMMFLCLTYDHRIIDGTPAIRFLQEIRRLLENPLSLLN
jgi:pyruvate/2-oxoglutarate dehydrogenase complex dihydrolipoamide acyltransferase (E2) component